MANQAETEKDGRDLWRLPQLFLKLGTIAFGGPPASPAEEHMTPPGVRPPFVEVRRGVGEERDRRDVARGEPIASLCRSGGRAAATSQTNHLECGPTASSCWHAT